MIFSIKYRIFGEAEWISLDLGAKTGAGGRRDEILHEHLFRRKKKHWYSSKIFKLKWIVKWTLAKPTKMKHRHVNRFTVLHIHRYRYTHTGPVASCILMIILCRNIQNLRSSFCAFVNKHYKIEWQRRCVIERDASTQMRLNFSFETGPCC